MSGATNPEAEIQNAENYGALASGMSLDKKLPQVAPEEQASLLSTSFSSQNDTMFIAIGINEGTRRADGSYTKHWSGTRSVDGRGMRDVSARAPPFLKTSGHAVPWKAGSNGDQHKPWLEDGAGAGTVGYNNVMFNVLDLFIQAPLLFRSSSRH